MKGFIQVYLMDKKDENIVQEVILNISAIKGVFRDGANGCSLWLDDSVLRCSIEKNRICIDETFEVFAERLERATRD